MKTNQLSVGDYVRSNNKLYMVKCVDLSDVITLANDEEEIYVLSDRIEGITINDEVLECCGFKVIPEDALDRIQLRVGEFIAVINTLSNLKDRGYYAYVLIDNQYKDSVGGCDVQYLNQIQQVIRLATGREIVIDTKYLKTNDYLLV